jgi:hypothetical protein
MKLRRRHCLRYVPVVACLVLAATPAFAFSYPAVYPGPSPTGVVPGYTANAVVSVPVTATVAANCSFDPSNLPSGSHDFGELNNALTAYQVNFGLECTTPLSIGIQSANGGLKTNAAAAAGYTNLRDYSVELFIQGTTTSTSGTCLASTLASTGSCSFKGPATNSSTTGGLYLADTAVNGSGYLSGSHVKIYGSAYNGSSVLVADTGYSDTLTVTLSAVY